MSPRWVSFRIRLSQTRHCAFRVSLCERGRPLERETDVDGGDTIVNDVARYGHQNRSHWSTPRYGSYWRTCEAAAEYEWHSAHRSHLTTLNPIRMHRALTCAAVTQRIRRDMGERDERAALFVRNAVMDRMHFACGLRLLEVCSPTF